MELETLMVSRVFAKSADLFASFYVGHVSDNLRTPFGRRKPFIALAPPLAALGLVLLTAPPDPVKESTATSTRQADVDPCTDTLTSGFNGTCETLQACVDSSINTGRLPPWSDQPRETGSNDHAADADRDVFPQGPEVGHSPCRRSSRLGTPRFSHEPKTSPAAHRSPV